MASLNVITTLQKIDNFKIDRVMSVSKMSPKKTPCMYVSRHLKYMIFRITFEGDGETMLVDDDARDKNRRKLFTLYF